jgi:putative Mg2+ transporter-C (MgtC) family protein
MEQDLTIMLQLIIAAVLGGMIGIERQITQKGAGLRTHMLVAIGATLLVALTDLVNQRTLASLPATLPPGFQIQIAPLVVIQAIVTGIGFLGAGTIFLDRGDQRVKGLTTAASIWVTAGIGITVGLTHYLLAAGATLLVVFVLHVVQRIEPAPVTREDEHVG